MSSSTHTTPVVLRFILLSILAQIIGYAAGIATSGILSSQILIIGAHALVALVVTIFLSLPFPWQMMNLALPFGVAFILTGQLPSELLLLITLVALLLYLPTLWTRVPYYPTSSAMYRVVEMELPEEEEFKMIDLGSGFGGMLKYLSTTRSNGKYIGVELSPLAYAVSFLKFIFTPNVEIQYKDFWKLDLSNYDIVYAFLAPGPMEKLWNKALEEMKPGAKLLINSFEVPGVPEKIVDAGDSRGTQLMVFHPRDD